MALKDQEMEGSSQVVEGTFGRVYAVVNEALQPVHSSIWLVVTLKLKLRFKFC